MTTVTWEVTVSSESGIHATSRMSLKNMAPRPGSFHLCPPAGHSGRGCLPSWSSFLRKVQATLLSHCHLLVRVLSRCTFGGQSLRMHLPWGQALPKAAFAPRGLAGKSGLQGVLLPDAPADRGCSLLPAVWSLHPGRRSHLPQLTAWTSQEIPAPTERRAASEETASSSVTLRALHFAFPAEQICWGTGKVLAFSPQEKVCVSVYYLSI